MPALKPFELKEKTGIIGMIAVLTAVLALILKWKDAYAFIVPEWKWLNWRFTIALALGVGLIVGIIMNVLWLKEYKNHTQTKYERDNLKTLLDLSEKKSMQDVTTGLPNGEKLIADIQKIITSRKESRNMQAILIDIKDFRSINKRHGFLKGDEILRRVAQSIQKSIRRNEDMYMAPLEQELWENVYRRYPGGDEFIFLIEGDQAAAVGFVVNRLLPSFKELTEIMP